jgi:hypothetical protein
LIVRKHRRDAEGERRWRYLEDVVAGVMLQQAEEADVDLEVTAARFCEIADRTTLLVRRSRVAVAGGGRLGPGPGWPGGLGQGREQKAQRRGRRTRAELMEAEYLEGARLEFA